MPNRRIEYVFGSPRPGIGHSLGVSALAISDKMILASNSYGTLVSGGRDGRLNAWSSSPQQVHAARVNDIHTNWVCDIIVHNADTVVSCSADTTVKMWNVKTNTVTTVGHHTDYAQCLARLNDDCVVSGGLDGSIIGWNVNIGRKIFEIKTDKSIYSLAAVPDPSGKSHIVVSGTHDGTVSVWDTRQPEFSSNHPNSAAASDICASAIAVFRGHTDNVRCSCALNSDIIISGSSDATVKVWSLNTGRMQKSFPAFHSSVWSLKPTKDGHGFWAGDRDGNIYETPNLDTDPRVIVEHACKEGGLNGSCINSVSDNIWISTPFSPDLRCIDPHKGGARVARMKGHSGLRKHRLSNDKRHVLVADTSGRIGMVDLVSAKSTPFERHIDLANSDVDAELNKILEEVNTMDVLDNWCLVQIKTGKICVTLDHRSINNTEVYLDDLQHHVMQIHKTPVPTPQQSPQSTPSNTPATSPMVTPQNSGFFNQTNSGFFRQGRSPFVSPAVSRVTSTQSMNESNRQTAAAGKAARQKKLGTGKGHAKFYDPDDDDDDNDTTSPAKSFYDAKQAPSSSVPSHTPKIKLNDDETEEPADSQTADDEIRINLGNFVLENLFRGVVDRLKKEYEELPAPPAAANHEDSNKGDNSRASTSSPSGSHTMSHSEASDSASSHAKPERKRTRFFNKLFGRKKDDDADVSMNVSASHSAAHTPSTHTASAGTQAEHSDGTNGTDGSATTNPQSIKQKHQQQQQNMADSSSFLEAWSRAVANHCMESADPEAPTPDVSSRQARLVVTEIAPGAGAPTEIYSTTVGCLIHNKSDADNIARLSPGWVGDALLLGKLNSKPPSKIGFAVHPGAPGLPELAPESTRLMAISMLRIRKIMAYTVGQLQQQKILTEKASECAPEDSIHLTCNGQEITALTTLATVRTRIWRKGGDVGMEYTLKKKV